MKIATERFTVLRTVSLFILFEGTFSFGNGTISVSYVISLIEYNLIKLSLNQTKNKWFSRPIRKSYYCGNWKNPKSGVKSQSFDDEIGENPSKDDAEASPEDGAHRQPESDVVVRVILLHVDLSVVRPRVAT